MAGQTGPGLVWLVGTLHHEPHQSGVVAVQETSYCMACIVLHCVVDISIQHQEDASFTGVVVGRVSGNHVQIDDQHDAQRFGVVAVGGIDKRLVNHKCKAEQDRRHTCESIITGEGPKG